MKFKITVFILGCLLFSFSRAATEQTQQEWVGTVKSCWLRCPDKAVSAGEQALTYYYGVESLDQRAVDKLTLIMGYLPRVYLDRTQFKKAEDMIQRFLALNTQSSSINDDARVLANLGIAYRRTGRHLLAQDTYEKTLQIYKKIGDEAAQGNMLNNLATVSIANNNDALAVQYLVEALPLLEKKAHPDNLATALSNIGALLANLGQFESAHNYLKRAEKILVDSENPRKKIENQTRIALYHSEIGNHSRAIEIMLNNIRSANENEFHDIAIQNVYQLSELYIATEQYNEAIPILASSRAKALSINAHAAVVRLDHLRAQVAFKLGEYSRAIEIAKNALTLGAELGAKNESEQLQYFLSEALQANGNIEESLNVLREMHLSYKQRMGLKQKTKREEFLTILEVKEKKQQIAVLEQQNVEAALAKSEAEKQHQQTVLITAIIITALILSSIVLWQRRKYADLKAKAAHQLIEQKNTMLAEVSHDLRTPLTAVKLQVEMLEHEIVDDPNKAYSIVHSKIAGLNRLIDDIFKLAQSDDDTFNFTQSKFFVLPWLNHILDGYTPLFANNELNLKKQLDIPDSVVLFSDKERLEQIFVNVLSNSVRYTNAGGSVIFSAFMQANNVVFQIEDSAPSVDDHELAHLFDKHFRGEQAQLKSQEGSGLGLATVKAFVTELNGDIEIDKSELGGLKCVLRFPL